jgi:hypothetical protein
MNGWSVGKDGRESCKKCLELGLLYKGVREVEGFQEKYRF